MGNNKRNKRTRPNENRNHNYKPTNKAERKDRVNSTKRSSHSKLQIVIIIAVCLFLFSCLLELIAYRIGSVTLIIMPLGSIIASIFACIKVDIFKPQKTDKKPSEDDSSITLILIGAYNIKQHIFHNTISLFLFALMVFLTCSTALAANHAGGRLLKLADHAIQILIQSSEDELPSNPPTPSNNNDDDSISPILTPSVYVDLNEPERIYSLPDEHYNELYYLDGAYKIEDWDDDEAILTIVREHVISLLKEKRTDFFSSITDPLVKAEIAQVSEYEAVMKTSKDLDLVITCREKIYRDYPCAKIAKLIAENYNGYGLSYYKICGNMKTVEYYWGASILWYRQALTFSNSSEDISSILKSIGTRYHDLAENYSLDPQMQIQAHKLYKAYIYLSQHPIVTD